MSGPARMRSDELARDRSRKGGGKSEEITKGQMLPVVVPDADPDWDPIALMIWESLSASGQADFYQQSDWAFAYNLCEELSIYKEARVNQKTGETYYKRSPEMFKGLLSAMGSLLMTEADRRRVRIELQAPAPDTAPASVTAIADYQAALEEAQPPGEKDDEETPS